MYSNSAKSIRLWNVLIDSLCPSKPTLNFDAILFRQCSYISVTALKPFVQTPSDTTLP